MNLKKFLILLVLQVSLFSMMNTMNNLSFKELHELAEYGETQAQFQVGMRYYNGMGVNKDLDKAIEWFKKSAKAGHQEAAYYLGLIYLQKRSEKNPDLKTWYKSVEVDPKKIKSEAQASAIYDKVINAHTKATKKNDPKSAYTLGLMFISGSELVINEEEALKWFELAEKLGHKNAKKYADVLRDKIINKNKSN